MEGITEHELYKGTYRPVSNNQYWWPGGEEQGEKKHAMRGEQEKTKTITHLVSGLADA